MNTETSRSGFVELGNGDNQRGAVELGDVYNHQKGTAVSTNITSGMYGDEFMDTTNSSEENVSTLLRYLPIIICLSDN